MPNSLYSLYDLSQTALTPVRYAAEAMRDWFQSPANPLAFTMPGRVVAAESDMALRLTRRFEQPEFGIRNIKIDGRLHKVREREVMNLPFCRLKHFEVKIAKGHKPRSKVLVAAPLSGHFATLLRGTVAALLQHHDVYITDWKNARNVPLSRGYFDLDDCAEYYMRFMKQLGPDIHILAVCQPSVPVFIAVSLMNKHDKANAPRSITLMGGPIDTRINPTEVNKLAMTHKLEWFEKNAISLVPPWYAGGLRRVYPGFLQLTGFLSMNLDRHIDSYFGYFQNLVKGDGQSAAKHREFYNEYLAVMDIPSEFYLQTVDRVFQNHLVPKRQYMWRGELADPADITETALLCIEGELDDISAVGQTKAALALCSNLPTHMKQYHMQEKAGHYGLFNGTRWREEVRPLLTAFADHFDKGRGQAAKKKAPLPKMEKGVQQRAKAKQKQTQVKAPVPAATVASIVA